MESIQVGNNNEQQYQQVSSEEEYAQVLQQLLMQNPQALQMLIDPQMAEVFQRLEVNNQINPEVINYAQTHAYQQNGPTDPMEEFKITQ